MSDENRWACPRCRGNVVFAQLEIAEIEGLLSEVQARLPVKGEPASPGMLIERVLEIFDVIKKRNTAR